MLNLEHIDSVLELSEDQFSGSKGERATLRGRCCVVLCRTFLLLDLLRVLLSGHEWGLKSKKQLFHKDCKSSSFVRIFVDI